MPSNGAAFLHSRTAVSQRAMATHSHDVCRIRGRRPTCHSNDVLDALDVGAPFNVISDIIGCEHRMQAGQVLRLHLFSTRDAATILTANLTNRVQLLHLACCPSGDEQPTRQEPPARASATGAAGARAYQQKLFGQVVLDTNAARIYLNNQYNKMIRPWPVAARRNAACRV